LSPETVVEGRFRRLTPLRPAAFIRRATRFLPTRMPSSRKALLSQSGVDAGRAVGAPRSLMYLPDFLGQHRVFSVSFRGRALPPCVVATGGDFQHLAHEANREFGPVRIYELEDFGGTSPVSRANQAVAFASISRSCFIWRSFLRSSRSSTRSSVESPSALFPSSRSACWIQLRMVCSVGSNSSASSEGFRPFRASSTIRFLNSSGYGGRESKAWARMASRQASLFSRPSPTSFFPNCAYCLSQYVSSPQNFIRRVLGSIPCARDILRTG
jgi:hypothetical protein